MARKVACHYLRHRGGALINIGSTVSDRAVPLQGAYSASKHAVKGFTDALRMELEEERRADLGNFDQTGRDRDSVH